MGVIVYLNGEFIPYDQAMIHVEDRGNMFADGVYEVVRYYGGRAFEIEAHLERLQRSAAAIRLPLPLEPQELAPVADELVRRNGLQEATVYMQISRGPAPRQHLFPEEPRPTLFMVARAVAPADESLYTTGVELMSLEDRRWKLCHVKSLALLANVLAKQEAKDAGAFDAVFVRDGIVTESTSANFFAVIKKTLVTHPEGPFILSGITRKVVLELAERLCIPVEERPFTLIELAEAEEAFITSTTIEVLPVVRIDGNVVGRGEPGPITKDLIEGFAQRKQQLAVSG